MLLVTLGDFDQVQIILTIFQTMNFVNLHSEESKHNWLFDSQLRIRNGCWSK